MQGAPGHGVDMLHLTASESLSLFDLTFKCHEVQFSLRKINALNPNIIGCKNVLERTHAALQQNGIQVSAYHCFVLIIKCHE